VRHATQRNTGQAELAVVRARPTRYVATVSVTCCAGISRHLADLHIGLTFVLVGRFRVLEYRHELGTASRVTFDDYLAFLVNPNAVRRAIPWSSVSAVVTNVMSIPRTFMTLS